MYHMKAFRLSLSGACVLIVVGFSSAELPCLERTKIPTTEDTGTVRICHCSFPN